MPNRVVHSKARIAERLAAAAPAGAPSVQYHGGPILQNVEVTTIFWGPQWTSDPLRAQLDAFFDFIVGSSLMDQLSEYSTNGMTIGHGSHVNSIIIGTGPNNPVDDSAIQSFLDSLIGSGMLPPSNANSAYFIFLPSGVTVTLQGESSCQQFCGYHNVSAGGHFYAADPYDDCQNCQFVPGDTLASSTIVASHELSEMITDPNLDAWFDDVTQNEIGDFCVGSNKVINTDAVLQPGSDVVSPAGPASYTISGSATADAQGNISGPIVLTLTVQPPPPPPPPPPPTQSWTIQEEFSNQAGGCV